MSEYSEKERSEERLDRVKRVLHEALELESSDRPAFLESVCTDDPELREEIESLLVVAKQDKGIHERPLFSLLDRRPAVHPEPGSRIGKYQILQPLGAGGMGVVDLAAREDDFHRKVAIKILHADLTTRSVIERFHRERQILADLDHPNIVRILDAGATDDGRPYFVMEYVEGENLADWLEHKKPGLRTRLELFCTICDAVHTAHQSLIVHRDIKPANLLIDQQGRPKLLDFGIAKPISPDLETLTKEGRSPMTLHSASPEQIEGKSVTTASDVYSLGVLFFFLLTRRLPYGEIDSHAALVRAICKTPARKPSVDVHSLDEDLDAISMKALRKEPEARYGSASQMREDVQRHLDGEPVLARQGSFLYVGSKFIRQNLRAVVMSTIAFLILAGLSFYAESLRRKSIIDRESANLSRGVLEAYVNISDDVDSYQAQRMLARVAEDVPEMNENPRLQAGWLDIVGDLYRKRGEWDKAIEYLSLSVEIQYDAGLIDKQTVLTLIDLAGAFLESDRYQEAEEFYLESIRLGEKFDLNILDFAKAVGGLGSAEMAQGDFQEAIRHYERALEIRLENDADPSQIAKNYRNLANLYYVSGGAVKGEEYAREAVEIRLEILGPDSIATASAWSTLGRILYTQGNFEEALEVLGRCLEIRREKKRIAHIAPTLRDLAEVYLGLGDLEQARIMLEEFYSLSEYEPGAELSAKVQSTEGALLIKQGEYKKARELLAGSSRTLTKLRGEGSIFARRAAQRLAEAEEAISRAVDTEPS